MAERCGGQYLHLSALRIGEQRRAFVIDGLSPRPSGLLRALCFDSCTERLLLFQTPDGASFRYESYSEDKGWTKEDEQDCASVREMYAELAEWEEGVLMEEIDLPDENAL